MAALFTKGTANASVGTASFVLPPGAAGGATGGPRNVVMDHLQVTLTTTTTIANGDISVRRNGVVQFQPIGDSLAQAAAGAYVYTIPFPGGVIVPGDPSLGCDISCGGTGVTAVDIFCIYHYEP